MTLFETVSVSGMDAMKELERLRNEFPRTGRYPIMFGNAEDYERLQEGMEVDYDVELTLQEAARIDSAEWLAERAASDPDFYPAEDGDWPDPPPPPTGLITHLDILTRKPKDEVFFGLLKVDAPWKAFAVLNWGAWNECPFPAEHCAMHQYWALRYDAEVVSITSDVVQCKVMRPPANRETAMRLAREQYVYCTDIVDQGTQTISELAASLVNSDYWFFWWD